MKVLVRMESRLEGICSMTEYKCDFCGELLSDPEMFKVTTFDGKTFGGDFREYSLCPRCFRKMKLFMKIQMRNGRKAAKRENH